jgi:hypothetical protein
MQHLRIGHFGEITGHDAAKYENGGDNYTKNLMFRSGDCTSDIYIHRDTGTIWWSA